MIQVGPAASERLRRAASEPHVPRATRIGRQSVALDGAPAKVRFLLARALVWGFGGLLVLFLTVPLVAMVWRTIGIYAGDLP